MVERQPLVIVDECAELERAGIIGRPLGRVVEVDHERGVITAAATPMLRRQGGSLRRFTSLAEPEVWRVYG